MMRSMAAWTSRVLVVVLVWCLAAATAGAQDIRQIKLTDKHVMGFIGAQKDLIAMADELQTVGDTPDPKLQAKLEQLAGRHGFASFEELDDVSANISLVMAGLDPQTGEFTDPVEALKQEMEEVRQDTSIPSGEKEQMLEELREAIKVTPPIEHGSNIEVVRKHREEIEKALQ